MARPGIFQRRLFLIIDVMAGSPNRSQSVVLIVEDEPLLRMLAIDVVEEAGFVALEAGDAYEAVPFWNLARTSLRCLRTSTCPET
ncbi:response regulator [Bradyrhizobium elkanii]|uniref:response regulator n=1 Tax=Bradyrhizobium elkanii TaxID=29448 RepID=UPI0007C52504